MNCNQYILGISVCEIFKFYILQNIQSNNFSRSFIRHLIFMTSTRKVGRKSLKFAVCLQILLILSDRSIIHFCRRGNWIGLNFSFMTLNVLLLRFPVTSKAYRIEHSFRKAIIFYIDNLNRRYFQWIFQNFQEAISLRILPTERPLLYIFSSLKFVTHVSCVNILYILFKNITVIKYKNWKWLKKNDKLKTDNCQQLHDVSPNDVRKMQSKQLKNVCEGIQSKKWTC